MPNDPYSPPVARLLAFGDSRELTRQPNYRALGIGPEHVPELMRMASDDGLNHGASDSPAVWAPVHAWRALGELRAESAVELLVRQLDRIDRDEDDWAALILPGVFAMIGPACIPALHACLAEDSHRLYARVAAAQSLLHIARQHPAARAAVLAALGEQLERFATQPAELNGFLVGDLIELAADDNAALIERAFKAGAVDDSIAGDWNSARRELHAP